MKPKVSLAHEIILAAFSTGSIALGISTLTGKSQPPHLWYHPFHGFLISEEFWTVSGIPIVTQ